jgi:hypothetical protein
MHVTVSPWAIAKLLFIYVYMCIASYREGHSVAYCHRLWLYVPVRVCVAIAVLRRQRPFRRGPFGPLRAHLCAQLSECCLCLVPRDHANMPTCHVMVESCRQSACSRLHSAPAIRPFFSSWPRLKAASTVGWSCPGRLLAALRACSACVHPSWLRPGYSGFSAPYRNACGQYGAVLCKGLIRHFRCMLAIQG